MISLNGTKVLFKGDIMFVKLFSVVTLLVTLSFNVQARDIAKEGAFVLDSDKSILRSLAVNKDLIFDHPSINGFEVYGPEGLYNFLRRQGIPFVELNNQDIMELAADYPSPEEIEKQLEDLHAKFPDLTQLIDIGRTVDGRRLLVLKISDNAAIDEKEPEFKYISSMHGDEITGRELMVKLATDLLNQYSSNSEIKWLVDTTEIYIMASMNPDGSAKRRRGNANYVDLNRNFPDFSTNDNQNIPGNREPETKAIMAFQNSRNFSLSSNFHGGAEVVNYAWDTIPDQHPLYDLLIELSLDYANKAPYIKNNGEFKDGITNGYEWYEVNNGMQDWSYYWHNDLQFTVELSQMKWPSYSKIPFYYEQNKPALISQIQFVKQGAGFWAQKPGLTGTVKVSAIENGSKKHVGTYEFKNSEFYKVLSAGEYSFEIEGPEFTGVKEVFLTVEKPTRTREPNFVQLDLD